MAKSYWDQDLEEFNPYYSQFYNKDGSSKTSQNDDSKDSLRESERNALSNNEQSFYRGNGRSNTDRNKNKNNKLSRFFIARKKGMAGLILSLPQVRWAKLERMVVRPKELLSSASLVSRYITRSLAWSY